MQGSGVSCLAQTGFAAFGKGVQLINGSPYDESEQRFRLSSIKYTKCSNNTRKTKTKTWNQVKF